MGFVTMKHMKSLFKAVIISAVVFFTSQFAVAQEQGVTIFFTGQIVGNYGPCG